MSDTPRVDAMIVKYPEPYSQLEINELYELARKLERELTTQNNKLAAIVRWLEVNQEDVFRRGLWDAINSSNPSFQGGGTL